MRINNVSASTSIRTMVIMSIFTVVVTSGLIYFYLTMVGTQASVLGYFEWLGGLFQKLKHDMASEPALPWGVFSLFWGMYIGFFASIFLWYRAKKKFDNKLNVKYINLLPSGIEVFYNRPEHNFVCSYSDVENLNMDIQSKLVRTKNGAYIAFEQLNLKFSLVGGRKIKLSNTPTSPIGLIYKIIDYTRGVQNFKYGFSGCGAINDYREKIDNYINFAYKDIIGKKGEEQFKLFSLLIFVLGIVLVIPFGNMIKESKIPFDPMMFLSIIMFFLVSFVFDIILVIDKIRDIKYGGPNEH